MNGVELLKCMCDDTRFEILERLQRSHELCVGDFVDSMKKDQPLVSHHLKTLRNCGIVKSRGEGKKIMYSISNKELSKLISDITRASKKIPVLCDKKYGCC